VNFQRLINYISKNTPEVAKSVLPGSLLAGGFGLMDGPAAAVTYGVADLATALPLTLGARALGSRIQKPILGVSPKALQGGLETVANIGGSLGSTVLASNLLYGNQYSQQQQLNQQIEQRSAINALPLEQQIVSPGTQFQTAGLPSGEDFQNLLNQRRGNWMQYLTPEDQQLIAGVISTKI